MKGQPETWGKHLQLLGIEAQNHQGEESDHGRAQGSSRGKVNYCMQQRGQRIHTLRKRSSRRQKEGDKLKVGITRGEIDERKKLLSRT